MSVFGSAPALITGAAIGGAAAAGLEPAVEVDRQLAWLKITAAIRDPNLLARLVAAGAVDLSAGRGEANRSGLSNGKFDALVWLAQTAPGTAELLELWRRGKIDEDLVDLGLAKSQLDRRYWPAVKELENARVAPPTIALAVQRGILENVKNPNGSDRLLTVTPDLAGASIDSPGQVPLDVLAEAKAWGWDFDRLAVDARIAGLPPAPGELMQLLNRQVINEADFLLGVAEGDTRNEWAQALMQLRHRVLSGVEAAELHVRGWIDQPTMYHLGELDGWTQERMDYLYDLRGRPISLRQAFIGERRGGAYHGSTADIPEWALAELGQSNIRPPWFNLAWAGRHSLPSAFVVRALLTDGALTQQQGEDLFLHSGWPEDLAALVAKHYAGGKAPAADKHVAKAQTSTYTALHKAYVDGAADSATVTEGFDLLGVDAAARPQVLALWDYERELERRRLTPAQVKKALKEGVPNPATGQPWTQDDALAYLIELGYGAADAGTFLAL